MQNRHSPSQFRFAAATWRDDGSARRREAAFSRFAAAGLPNRHNESWHYTDLRALLREALPTAPTPDQAWWRRHENVFRLMRYQDRLASSSSMATSALSFPTSPISARTFT